MTEQPDLAKLVSEQALQDWNDIVSIRRQLALLDQPSKTADGKHKEREKKRQGLLQQYRDLKNRQRASEPPQVVVGLRGPTFGFPRCGGCRVRPFTIANWRSLPPGTPQTSGSIETTAITVNHGSVEFRADLVNTAPPDPDDYSVWLQQWVYLYVFPAASAQSTLNYEFRLWPNTWWFTETGGRRVVIMLHLGIEHVPNLGSVGGPIYDELWPVVIDTALPEYGPYGFPSGWTLTVSGSFTVLSGNTPALALFPGVFALVPSGLVQLPAGFFWVSNEFPVDTTDQDRWGWISYCLDPVPVISPEEPLAVVSAT